MFDLYSTLSAKWFVFQHARRKYKFSCVVVFFINLNALDAMLPIMAKLSISFK